MTSRVLTGLTIAGLVAVGGFATVAASVGGAQDATTRPAAAPEVRPVASEDFEMAAIERHARVDMILYGGRFADTERAAVRTQLDAIALTLPAGAK